LFLGYLLVQIIDENIISQLNQGNKKAFEQLYTAYYVYLCAVATKYLYKAEIAQEIVNDVFMNVWDKRADIVYPANAYLIKAVQNRCLNYIQRQRRKEVPLSDIQERLLTIQEQQIGPDSHPLAYLENKEFEEKIYKAISTLPEKCREIFEQYLYQNKSYNEIAETNQITHSTVRVQIKIGLSKLKDLLGDYYPLFLLLFDFTEI